MDSKMKRTKGSQSEVGMLYQYGVTALVAAQLSGNNQVEDYIIYSSEDSAGKFDDIVTKVKLKGQDDWYLYLIQVKSKDTKALNVSDKLKGKRVEYFLSDYIQCFNDILANPNLTCRYGIPNDNIRFSIFCTKSIQKPVFLRQDCTFALDMHHCSEKGDVNDALFLFGKEYFKFFCKDLEHSDIQFFFNKCSLYLNQPNYNKLNNLIENACQIKNTREIINYVKDYFNDDDLYAQGLRKELFEIELQKIRLVDAIPPLTSFADFIDADGITIWNDITTTHDITAVNCTQNFAIEPYLYSCIVRKINSLLHINIDWKTYTSNNNNLGEEVIEKFLTYSKTKRLRYWIDPPTTLRVLIIELWKCGDLPLILKTHTQLTNFEKYIHLKRNYIVLDDWTSRSEEIMNSKMDIFTSLSSITNSDLQNRILEDIIVSPQGRKPVTLKNLLHDDKTLMSAFTCTDVLRMMRKRTPFLKESYYKGSDYLAFIIEDEDCEEISECVEPYGIGHNFRVTCPPGQINDCIKMICRYTNISHHYTTCHLRKTGEKIVLTQGDPQKLRHRFVDQYGEPLFISDTGEFIPIIGQTIELNEIQYISRQLRRVTLPRSFFSLQETQICVLSGDLKFIENSIELSNIHDLLKEAKALQKKTYFIKVHKKEDHQCYWRKLCYLKYPIFDIYVRGGKLELLKSKNCKNLHYYILYDGGTYSEQEFLNEIRAGSDKISVVTGDAGIGKSSFLKWLCNNYSTEDYIIFYDLINLQVDLNKSERHRIDLIDFIFKETQKDLPEQYTEFVSILRQKRKLIWVLDSFDEIRLACEKQILDLIRVISNSGAQTIIAARIENCKILMDQFEIHLIKVEPLEQEDCVSYWELDQDLLRNISSELATNPLYLNFLKLISISREKLVNTTKYTLYEKVINLKIKHCLRTTYQILHDSDIERVVVLFERLALVALFGQKAIEEELLWACDNQVFDMTKFGIVVRFDEDNNPIFYHRSFVEFLFAQWIAKACQINMYKSAARHLYKHIFNENKLHILNILFEDEELHRAILQADTKRIKAVIKRDSDCLYNVDKLGRAALHVAVIYCSYSNVLFISIEVLDLIMTSMTQSNLDMGKPDIIMNWDWSDYIQPAIFNFAYGSENMEVVRIYMQLYRRKIEKYNCSSPVFPTKGFYSIFLWALKFGAIDMISDLVLLQNFEKKMFHNFDEICLALVPETLSLVTKKFQFEGQLTPLHVASIFGNVSVIQHLIKIGADINSVDMFSCTPLHYCIMRCDLLKSKNIDGKNRNIESVKLLLESGADANALVARVNGVSPLYLAVQTKNLNVVVLLLQFEASILNRRNHSTYADHCLHLAVSLGCTDIVRCLLQHGAPRYLKDKQNKSVLDIAIKQNHTEMIQLLSENDDAGDIQEKEKMRAVYIGTTKYRYANDSPLHAAVSRNNVDLIKILLRRGADINVLDTSGSTPLLAALRIKNIEAATFLLSKGADFRIKNKHGHTALLTATAYDSIEAIKMLLEYGDNTNIATPCNWTPLHAAVLNNSLYVIKLLLEKGANVNAQDLRGSAPVYIAVLNGYEESAKLLIANGADLQIRDEIGRTPLLRSIVLQYKTISALLIREGANANSRDNLGRTPLLAAVYWNDVDTARLLLEKGANVNDEDFNGFIPLLIASQNGNMELVKLLVENEANINVLNKDGVSALQLAADKKQIHIIKFLLDVNVDIDPEGGTTALSCCICERDVNSVRLLLKKGARVNSYDNRHSCTLLHMAAAKSDADTVGLLLENGAYVNANSGQWFTPLYQAVKEKHPDIVKLLIAKGANVNVKYDDDSSTILVAAINTRDITIVEMLLDANADDSKEARFDALISAVFVGDIEIIKLLLNKGVDLNICNKNNDTPLYAATVANRADIVEVLLENGADVNVVSKYGVTPFAKAVLDGRIEIARQLLNRGANVNNQFEDGTALHQKTTLGDVDFVKLLIEKGADMNLRNKDGMTAIEIAKKYGYGDIVKILLCGEEGVNSET